MKIFVRSCIHLDSLRYQWGDKYTYLNFTVERSPFPNRSNDKKDVVDIATSKNVFRVGEEKYVHRNYVMLL